MLSWLRRRRETAERIEDEAEAVMRGYAVRAYAEARRREREARSVADAENWRRAALTIAEKTYGRAGFDIAARMAAGAGFELLLPVRRKHTRTRRGGRGVVRP
jgi:hypothetical protein